MDKDEIIKRASNPSRKVAKVVAVRIKGQHYDILQEQASLAGVKVCDLVRASIESFCEEAEKV